MRIQTILIISVLALSVGPLAAAHRHGRDCGHRFDSHGGSWISVQAVTPFGFGVVHRSFADNGYQRDFRRFQHGKKYWKRVRKQQRKQHRRFHRESHRHGPKHWR